MPYCLVYISTANELYDDDVLADLLAQARNYNRVRDITGLLIYHDRSFFQIIEGKRRDVLTLYSRIERDKRHHGCILLRSSETEKRLFASWSMAYIAGDQLDPAQRKNFIDLLHITKDARLTGSDLERSTQIYLNTFLESLHDLVLF